MINKEIRINVAGRDMKVFMQDDFFDFFDVDTGVHKHGYAEIHCIESGTMEYVVDGQRMTVEAGDLVAIPAGVFHGKRIMGEGRRCACVFQVNLDVKSVARYKISPDIFTELIRCIGEYKRSGNAVKLSAYLSLVCSYLLEGRDDPIVAVQDRQFLICEFFYNNYHLDVTLGDLSKVLNLSEKQTERMVLQYTGRRFRKELSYRRIEAAHHILETEKITLREAAERVGYKSYSGFFKAYREFGGE